MNGLSLSANQTSAIQLLGKYTAGSFAIWNLAGPRQSAQRAEIMSELKGVRTPQTKSGVTALFEAFMDVREQNLPGQKMTGCPADRDSNLVAWLKLADDYRKSRTCWGAGDPHMETAYDAVLNFNFAPYGGLVSLNGWIGYEDFEFSRIEVRYQEKTDDNAFIVEFKPGTSEVTWVGIVPCSSYEED
jgi:hypothetical protein